uniref:Uncharacterized protein n=1 Tax=Timema monikensis TaxID=170555 RepID=A0A7R9EIM8_9NEOP|nr:unnamed protein product [Timema monikensis]
MFIHFRLLSRPSSYLIYVRSIRTKFNKAFGKYLYLTNTITCGVLMGAGDIVQQKIETYNSLKKDYKFDWHRSDTFGLPFQPTSSLAPHPHLHSDTSGLPTSFLPKETFIITTPTCFLIHELPSHSLVIIAAREGKTEETEWKYMPYHSLTPPPFIFVIPTCSPTTALPAKPLSTRDPSVLTLPCTSLLGTSDVSMTGNYSSDSWT